MLSRALPRAKWRAGPPRKHAAPSSRACFRGSHSGFPVVANARRKHGTHGTRHDAPSFADHPDYAFVEGLAPQRIDGPTFRQPVRPAELVGDLALGRHAEGMEQGGGEVGGGDGTVGGLGGMAVARAVDLAAADA